MDTSDELIHDFIEEANDLLDSLDLGIVEMEKNPQDAAKLYFYINDLMDKRCKVYIWRKIISGGVVVWSR